MKEVKSKEPNYIFPDFLAKAMSKVDLRTQYEATMLSMSFINIGLIITIIYFLFFFEFPTWYKIILVINTLAGLVFIWSFIITTYNQYRTYMVAQKFQEEQRKNG